MACAGAEMLCRTAEDGTMGVPSIGRLLSMRKTAADIVSFAASNSVTVHIGVDSPAANLPICRRTKRCGASVVQLVAPQLWAWGPWRIGRVRRIADHVICLLPFEEAWFRSRGVAATFVGHPVINAADPEDLGAFAPPTGSADALKVLLLPGSRTLEVERNAELLVECWQAIARAHPNAQAVVCAAGDLVRRRFEGLVGGRLGSRATLVTEAISRAAAWCDFAIAVSGTVSLDLTRARKPLIGVYRTGPIAALAARAVLSAGYRLLPNILAGRELVPEFVPCSGSSAPIVASCLRMAADPSWRQQISRGMDEIVQSFAGHDPGAEAAGLIVGVAMGERALAHAKQGIPIA